MATLQHERQPAAYHSDPVAPWPTLPQPVLAPPAQSPPSDITLPNLRTVLSPDFDRLSPPPSSQPPPFLAHPLQQSRPHLPPAVPINHVHDRELRQSWDLNSAPPPFDPISSAAAVLSPLTTADDRFMRAPSVVSMDDPDVRIAAEALSGLGNAGYSRSQSLQTHSIDMHLSPPQKSLAPSSVRHEPEPLLELIAQRHPWVGGTIKGSISAYSTTKYYSPRIVQYGANLVERNITTPVVSVVSSVGEMTGVENGIRRYLEGARRSGDIEGNAVSENAQGYGNKRRYAGDPDIEMDDASDCGRESVDFRREQLPPYGASRPPSYREEQSPAARERLGLPKMAPSLNRSWSSQILVTTSGLSVALSSTSRHSLRFCLGLLTESFRRVHNLTTALSMVLHQYEAARQHLQDLGKEEDAIGASERDSNDEAAARRLADNIQHHCNEIWQTLRAVVNNVSNYAGGALPENAREFVRDQLLSMPQRWRLVNDGQASSDADASRSAQRMIAFASEGLDMINQVSGVVHATLESAEQWLARVGRSDPDTSLPAPSEDRQPINGAQWTLPPLGRPSELEKS